jgi:hypothetical protein
MKVKFRSSAQLAGAHTRSENELPPVSFPIIWKQIRVPTFDVAGELLSNYCCNSKRFGGPVQAILGFFLGATGSWLLVRPASFTCILSEWWETLVMFHNRPWYNPLPPTSAATAGPTGLRIFLGGTDPVFNIGFVPLLPFIAMLALILAAQGMNFPTKTQALLFLRNARKTSACQSAVL